MRKYLNFLLLIAILFIFYSLKSTLFFDVILNFPDENYELLPRWIQGITAILSVVIYVIGVMILYFKERKIDPNLKLYQSYSWYWFFARPFLSRYKNVNFVVLLNSLMITCFLFSIAIPLTYFFISLCNPMTMDPVMNNPLSFLHNQGLIISFIAMFIVIYTFINTRILRSKYEREIETLEELFFILGEKLDPDNDKKYWGRFANIFYYVFDYTIATGHFSNPAGFQKYAVALRKFVERHKVDFKGLIYENQKNLNYYEKSLENRTDLPDDAARKAEAEKLLLEAHDFLISYFNKVYTTSSGSTEEIQEKIRYQPFRAKKEDTKNPFFKDKLRIEEIPDKSQDQSVLQQDEAYEQSSIYQVNEIGITRFILSNNFVIQFIATKKDNTNIATGYISEDINVIERFKTTFCDYREEHRLLRYIQFDT